MHFKNRKPKAARGGPKWNKPWKLGRIRTESPQGEKFADRKRRGAGDPDRQPGDGEPDGPDGDVEP